MMHGRGKSDLAIVAAKLVNKAGRLAAESVPLSVVPSESAAGLPRNQWALFGGLRIRILGQNPPCDCTRASVRGRTDTPLFLRKRPSAVRGQTDTPDTPLFAEAPANPKTGG